MRVRDWVGSVRPRKSAAVLVVGAVAVGAGGVGWAATRASTSGVITACANADNVLALSTSGSCPSGQTLVQWDVQGPQGPPGQQGPPGAAATATGPILAWAPSSYKPGFTMSTLVTAPGDYVADGSVDAALTPAPKLRHSVAAICSLLTGPPNGTATAASSWKFMFVYHRTTKSFLPPSVHFPVEVNTGLGLSGANTPLEVYFVCRGFSGAVWTHPTITIENAVTSTFHPTVGPALPNRPVIGPGPIAKVLGTGSGQTH